MADNIKQFHLHLVSDATGDTLDSVAKAALAQFKGARPIKHYWPMIRTPKHMQRILPEIEEHPGLIMYTLVNEEIKQVLIDACHKKSWPYISVMETVMAEFARFLGVESQARPGLQHEMNDEYFRRIEAIQYTLIHDDGQLPEGLDKADIVLVGVSRTSKTPTCIYLANKGYKCANVPMVPGCPLPQELYNLKDKFIVGLVNSPDRLVQIRRNRLLSLNEQHETDYIDIEAVKEEVKIARRLFISKGWPILDVTRRSIEETAAAVINLKSKYEDELNGEPVSDDNGDEE